MLCLITKTKSPIPRHEDSNSTNTVVKEMNSSLVWEPHFTLCFQDVTALHLNIL